MIIILDNAFIQFVENVRIGRHLQIRRYFPHSVPRTIAIALVTGSDYCNFSSLPLRISQNFNVFIAISTCRVNHFYYNWNYVDVLL